MIPAFRKRYNQSFTEEKYEAYIQALQNIFPGQLDFRVAETPVFVPDDFLDQVLDTCDYIICQIESPEYRQKSERAIPSHLRVPKEDERPHCIAFDFGVCLNSEAQLEPQLIEMQGFPSLFAWEVFIEDTHQKNFWTPEGYHGYLGGHDRDSYIELLKRVIIGEDAPQQTILLEIFPEQQKTRVDFHATEDLLGIKTVCLTKLKKDGKKLYYDADHGRQYISRIYNRVIFDDLFQQPAEVQEQGKIFQEELDVTWVPHPNWFYKISKFTMPFIHHKNVPPTHFLSEIHSIPSDLSLYVVKPLFSFAGQGVIIDVTRDDIDRIEDKENWIIQKKVQYAAAIETPDEHAKVEMRIFYFYDPALKTYVPANNLARLSKGKMVGVRYNKDRTWVGGSYCLFKS